MELSVVIPACNEERRIAKTLNSYFNLLKTHKSEIIVVCNGCTDRTVEIVKEFMKKSRTIHLLKFSDRIGKGRAIIEGFKVAKGECIGFVDADDAFDAKQVIDNALHLEGYDCFIASKWIGKCFGDVKEGWLRKFFSRCWNVLVRILLGLKFYDTQAGAKFLRRKCLDQLNNEFRCYGFEFDVELLYLLKKYAFNVREIFIDYDSVGFSTFSLKYIPKMFWELIKIPFRNYK